MENGFTKNYILHVSEVPQNTLLNFTHTRIEHCGNGMNGNLRAQTGKIISLKI